MNILKKRPIAILIMIAAIVIATFIGAYRSLGAERERILGYLDMSVEISDDSVQQGPSANDDVREAARIKMYNIAAAEFNAELDNIVTGTLARLVGIEPLTIIAEKASE